MLLIQELQLALWLDVKESRNCMLWHLTFGQQELELPLIASMFQVSLSVYLSHTCLEMVKRELELHRFNSHTESRVIMAAARFVNHVFRYGGHLGTYMIIAGFDVRGPQIIEISADGVINPFPYLALGSGSLQATSIMETGFKDDMTEEEAIALCVKSIEAGIVHDLGSGSNVDVCVLKKGKTTYMRGYKSDNHKMFNKPDGYTFKKERVQVLNEYKHKLVVEEGAVPMEL